MAAYAQFGYGYPSAHQLVSGAVVVQSTAAADISQAAVPTTTTPSPLSGANEASLSPSGGSTATAVATGPVSPGVISQISNNTGTGACTSTGVVVDNATTATSLVDVGGAGIAAAKGTSCCENGRPIMTDPVSGHTVCSCQYDSARLAVSGYSRMPSSNVGVYGTPYPSTEQNPYPSIGVDSTAFYSPLGNPYSLKENAAGSDMTAWTSAGLQPTTSYYSYDPTLAAYGYGAGYDLAARRKNATRESTATLKAWLNEHKKNPYPTKGEKIMLAIITKMTLTQVSTWFANARRRLKKENKMTWEPKNKTEDDDAMLSDDEKEGKDAAGSEKPDSVYGKAVRTGGDHRKDFHLLKSEIEKDGKTDDLTSDDHKTESTADIRSLSTHNSSFSHPGYNTFQQQYQQKHHNFYQHGSFVGTEATSEYSAPKNLLSRDCGIPIPATKPKIWSLADTVACKTPPPTTYLGQQYFSAAQEQQLPHHPHLHLLPHISNSRNNNTSGHLLHTDQQHSQQLNPLAPSSPLSMMNNYVAVSPYSQIPTGYGNNAFNCNISNSTGIPTTPTTPHSMNVHQHHYQHQHQQYQTQQQLQRMGFLEIQPDTPPQTPPNMKHSNANVFAANPLPAGPTTALKTGMCYRGAGVLNRPYNGHSPVNNANSNYGLITASKKEV